MSGKGDSTGRLDQAGSPRNRDDNDSEDHQTDPNAQEPDRELGPGLLRDGPDLLLVFVAVPLASELVPLPFAVMVHGRPSSGNG